MWVKENGIEIDELFRGLNNIKTKIIFIQNNDDPFGSYNELVLILSSNLQNPFKVIKVSSDTHKYDEFCKYIDLI